MKLETGGGSMKRFNEIISHIGNGNRSYVNEAKMLLARMVRLGHIKKNDALKYVDDFSLY